MFDFQLEFPYSEDWDKGFVVINPEKRRNILLLNKSTGKRTTVSYARYLMSVKMKRYLLPSEQVDHINGKKEQDFIENLQIVSKKQNNVKSASDLGRTRAMAKIICPFCGVEFTKAKNQTHIVKKGSFTACSKKCSSKIQALCDGDVSRMKEIGNTQSMAFFRKVVKLDVLTSSKEYDVFSCNGRKRVLSNNVSFCGSCLLKIERR